MGNRDDLIAGAKRCLYEKGYARTTARDIAQASGVSLAAIGYHFGSKEALLAEAMLGIFADWGMQFTAIDPGSTKGIERFGAVWDGLLQVATQNRRVTAATFEVFPASEHIPELRSRLADAQQYGRRGLVSLMHGIPEEEVSDRAAQTLGSLYFALVCGVLAQWLVDPERAPQGDDLAQALRVLASGDPLPE